MLYRTFLLFIFLILVVSSKAIHSEYIQEKTAKYLDLLWFEAHNIELYILAFIHRSIVNERCDFTPEHNERLEFLGDAVLEIIITEELFKNYPETPEGDMTDMRSALVRGRNLAIVAKKIGLSEHLLLWKGEEKWGWRENNYILANTLEAFIGALYLDQGFEITKNFVLKNIYSTLPDILEKKLFKDFKTLLQEHLQASQDVTPHYDVISEDGPDHDKMYLVWVFQWEKKLWEWTGTSKKKAQEKAAENAYLQLI